MSTKREIPSQETARLEVNQVTVGYYNHPPALENVSFEVPYGSRVAVVGPNGSGKSTLFKALVGLLPLRQGSIRIHSEPLGHHQDCVAYIPQREEVDWRFPVSVEDVVMMGRYGRFGWFRQPTTADREIVRASLAEMGMERFSQVPIGDLSGGQQQRVFLARALAQEPHILLMDEPFNGVDAATQEATMHLLDDLRQRSVTVLVSTHDLHMAAERFDLTLLLNRKMIAYGASSQVFTSEKISQAFGGQVLVVGSEIVVVDECCPPDEEKNR